MLQWTWTKSSLKILIWRLMLKSSRKNLRECTLLLNWSSSRDSILTFDLDSTFGIKIRSRLVESKPFTKFRLKFRLFRLYCQSCQELPRIKFFIYWFFVLYIIYLIYTVYALPLCLNSLRYIFTLFLCIISLHYLFTLSLCIISLHYLFTLFLCIIFLHCFYHESRFVIEIFQHFTKKETISIIFQFSCIAYFCKLIRTVY